MLLWAAFAAGVALVWTEFLAPGLGGLRERLGPFHSAVERGDRSTVLRLLRSGTSVDLRTENGDTALSMALEGRDWAMADLLRRHGADLDARIHGQSMLLLFALARERQPYEWLLAHRARLDPEANSVLKERGLDWGRQVTSR